MQVAQQLSQFTAFWLLSDMTSLRFTCIVPVTLHAHDIHVPQQVTDCILLTADLQGDKQQAQSVSWG